MGSWRVRFRLILGVGAAALVVCAILLWHPPHSIFNSPKVEPLLLTSTETVKDGDNLAVLLKRTGLTSAYADKIERTLNTAFNVRRMLPGHSVEVVTSTDGIFQRMNYRPNLVTTYTVTRSSMSVYDVSQSTKATFWTEKKVSVDVTSFLYGDLMKQGYDPRFVDWFIGNVADYIFAWQIDFFTEQRPGDKLDVLLEQEYIQGTNPPLWTGRGRILAARYIGKATRQKENFAARFEIPGVLRSDYYDGQGNAVRKAFLRAPFTHGVFRVSSGFTNKRFHPILRTYRAHHGIDYAAPYGSGVASIGAGHVVFAGWKGGFGNCIEIQHSPKKYLSRYGHLSYIAVRLGQHVEQGRYIGRVGSTGLSTGPHLHFEILVDGQKTNFLSMTFPPIASLTGEQMPAFQELCQKLLPRLESQEKNLNGAEKRP